MGSDWFRRVWDAMSEEERDRIRAKAQWEECSLRAVLIHWPSLAPEHVRAIVPAPVAEEPAGKEQG